MKKWLSNRSNRAWVYNTMLAASPLVLFYGLMSNTEIALWLGFGQSVLGLGLARIKVNEAP